MGAQPDATSCLCQGVVVNGWYQKYTSPGLVLIAVMMVDFPVTEIAGFA